MRQGYFGFLLEESSINDLGGSCFLASALAIAFPFFLPLEALSTSIDWTTCTSEVLPRLDEFLEGLLEPMFAIDFCFEEAFAKV